MHTRYESSKVAKAAGLIRSGGVAQLVRVPPCHGGCCGFKSRLSRHYFSKSIGPFRKQPSITAF